MNFFETIILAVVEGITEFLPVSSTGHLIIASDLLGIPDSQFLASFTIAVQLGAILAVLLLYAKRLVTDFDTWKKITIAFIPTAIVGLLFFSFLKGLLANETVVVWGILGGGIIMILVELFLKKTGSKNLETVSAKNALIVGLAQAVAFIPGVSRSAATIIGGLLLGLSRKTIVEFSFLLALPTMVAATGYDLLQTGSTFLRGQWEMLLLGVFISFFVAVLAIKWLLRFVEKYTFIPFGVYRILIGVALLFILVI